MKHIDLFSGIGGFALATEMVWGQGAVEHIFCDNEPFAQAIIKKHWPNAPIYGDINVLNEGLVNGTIVLWNEDAMASAPTVKNGQKQKDVRTANLVTPSEYTSGMLPTERNVEKEIGSGHAKRKTKSLNTMVESVSAAEKSKSNFLQSTMLTAEETSNAELINRKHGSSLEKTGSQQSIESSATTATTPSITTKYAPTKTNRIDLLTGGFPCQPFSAAGKRRGTEDGRHLWPAMLRTIRILHPRWVIGENVSGLLTWGGGMVLEQIHTDLEGEGYEVQAFIVPAVSVNAPHRRDRVWIVAHAKSDDGGRNTRELSATNEQGREEGQEGRITELGGTDTNDTDTRGKRLAGNKLRAETSRQPRQLSEIRSNKGADWNQNWTEVATRLCTLDDGVFYRLSRPNRGGDAQEFKKPKGWRNAALKGAGNAIVPQVAAEIMKVIKQIDENMH